MAVISKYGSWDNATYPWEDQTSAGIIGSIAAEIDAWITAISGNASIVGNGQLPVKKRDQTSSTNTGTRNGFVYEFPDTTLGLNKDGPTYPTFGLHGTQTSVSIEVGDEYLDTTANDGYGDWGSTTGHVSGIVVAGDTGYNNQAVIAYETNDGEEFFAIGMKVGAANNTDEICFIVFKDTDGHWCFVMKEEAFAYDNKMEYWAGEVGPYDTDPTMDAVDMSYHFPLVLISSAPTGASTRPNYGTGGQGYWYPKSSKLYKGRGTVTPFGSYSNYGASEQIMNLAYVGQSVIIPV